jgi:hypothetical protein
VVQVSAFPFQYDGPLPDVGSEFPALDPLGLALVELRRAHLKLKSVGRSYECGASQR